MNAMHPLFAQILKPYTPATGGNMKTILKQMAETFSAMKEAINSGSWDGAEERRHQLGNLLVDLKAEINIERSRPAKS